MLTATLLGELAVQKQEQEQQQLQVQQRRLEAVGPLVGTLAHEMMMAGGVVDGCGWWVVNVWHGVWRGVGARVCLGKRGWRVPCVTRTLTPGACNDLPHSNSPTHNLAVAAPTPHAPCLLLLLLLLLQWTSCWEPTTTSLPAAAAAAV